MWTELLHADASPPTVGARRVLDTDLPGAPADEPLRVVLTGGAGQVAGPVGLCERRGFRLVALETTLADPGDPAGNARRVVAAADAAGLDPALLHVGVAGAPGPSWLAAADEVAMAGAALCLDLDAGPQAVEEWIDAALDRELAFSVRGGAVADAVAALSATARLWGDPDDLQAATRWCRSWSVPAGLDLDEVLRDLSG
jgi:hypothetical protein